MTSRIDEIVTGLAAGAELVDEGAFTIDRAHALRKLEQYQMRDPSLAAARFVEATALLGGSLRAIASPWGLRFLLHRVYLSRREAADLLLYPLESRRSPRERAIAELAVGMLAAARTCRKPPTLTSSDTEGAYRVSFGSDHTPTLVALDDDWSPTSIALVRFWLPLPLDRRKPEDLRELDVLRVLAHWSTADVFIDDTRVSLGLPRQHFARHDLHEPGVRGVVGLRHPQEGVVRDAAFARYAASNRCTLHILSNGIHIEAFELPAVPSAVCVTLDVANVRKDVAHERIVRDAAFQSRLDWLRDRLVEYGDWLRTQPPPPTYAPAQFGRVIESLIRLDRISA